MKRSPDRSLLRRRPLPAITCDGVIEEAARALAALDEFHALGTEEPGTWLPRPVPVLCRSCWSVDEPTATGSWCACRPSRPWELRHVDNRRLRLCLVCAGDVLPWRSRFSWLLCEPCGQRADALNRRLGVLSVPLGIHPWVNGGFRAEGLPTWPDGTHGLGAASLVAARLRPWRRELTRRHCAERGLIDGRDVPLTLYRLALEERPVDRAAAFEAALVYLASGPRPI